MLRTVLDLPGNKRVLHLNSSVEFSAAADGVTREADSGLDFNAEMTIETPGPAELVIRPSAGHDDSFDLSYHTDLDPHERPIPFERLILPWAKDLPPAPDAPIAHVKLGDWARGKALFFAESQCAACHTVRGEGGAIGPDLSNLTFKDPAATLNDIINPSSAINPDYISYIVKLKDGQSLTGLVAADGNDHFNITEGPGKSTTIPRAQIQSLTPSPTSLMPEGLKALGDDKLNDLLEFLTGEQPKK